MAWFLVQQLSYKEPWIPVDNGFSSGCVVYEQNTIMLYVFVLKVPGYFTEIYKRVLNSQ